MIITFAIRSGDALAIKSAAFPDEMLDPQRIQSEGIRFAFTGRIDEHPVDYIFTIQPGTVDIGSAIDETETPEGAPDE